MCLELIVNCPRRRCLLPRSGFLVLMWPLLSLLPELLAVHLLLASRFTTLCSRRSPDRRLTLLAAGQETSRELGNDNRCGAHRKTHERQPTGHNSPCPIAARRVAGVGSTVRYSGGGAENCPACQPRAGSQQITACFENSTSCYHNFVGMANLLHGGAHSTAPSDPPELNSGRRGRKYNSPPTEEGGAHSTASLIRRS